MTVKKAVNVTLDFCNTLVEHQNMCNSPAQAR